MIYHYRAKKFTIKHGFWNIENSNRKVCFQMTLNARKSCADSFLKIKTDDNRARLSRNQQNNEKLDSKT